MTKIKKYDQWLNESLKFSGKLLNITSVQIASEIVRIFLQIIDSNRQVRVGQWGTVEPGMIITIGETRFQSFIPFALHVEKEAFQVIVERGERKAVFLRGTIRFELGMLTQKGKIASALQHELTHAIEMRKQGADKYYDLLPSRYGDTVESYFLASTEINAYMKQLYYVFYKLAMKDPEKMRDLLRKGDLLGIFSSLPEDYTERRVYALYFGKESSEDVRNYIREVLERYEGISQKEIEGIINNGLFDHYRGSREKYRRDLMDSLYRVLEGEDAVPVKIELYTISAVILDMLGVDIQSMENSFSAHKSEVDIKISEEAQKRLTAAKIDPSIARSVKRINELIKTL